MATERAGSVGGPEMFVRQSTGLVREVSWVDAAIYNLAWSSIPFAFAFMALFGLAFYHGADLYLSTVVTLLLTLPTAVVFALLSAAVPRSGGDYTWISRTIHPALGFASNLSWTFWVVYYISIYATYMATYAIAPLLRVVAGETGSSAALSVSDFFGSTTGVLALGLVMVLLGGAVLIFGRGLQTFVRLLRWAFYVWMIGTVILPILIVAVTSPAGFQSNFDQYVQTLGGPSDAYTAVVSSAGYSPPAFDLMQSLLMVTLPFYAVGFIFPSVYLGGEIRTARLGTLLAIPGAQIISVVALLILSLVYLGTMGQTFLASVGLADLSTVNLAFAPLYVELAAIASGNLIVGLLVTLGMVALFLIYVPLSMLMVSRNLFAWSFDRLLPERVAEVSERTHSPVVAVSIVVVVALAGAVFLAANSQYTALVGLFGLVLTYLTVAITAILFPYRQRVAFEASPYPQRVGGVPVLSVAGVLALVGMIGIAAILLSDSNSGTSLSTNLDRVVGSVGIFLVGIPIYYLIRAFQRTRGIDIDRAYRAIPPD